MVAILVLILSFTLPALDLDGDGATGSEERAAGCDPFDHTSHPYCLPGAAVPGSCSSSIPGAELEPC